MISQISLPSMIRTVHLNEVRLSTLQVTWALLGDRLPVQSLPLQRISDTFQRLMFYTLL